MKRNGLALSLVFLLILAAFPFAGLNFASAVEAEYKIQGYDNNTGDYIISAINVRDYGAKGDGVSDDWSAFDTALKAVRPRGGMVYVPAGKYRITKPLYVYAQTNFRGQWNNPSTGINKPETVLIVDFDGGSESATPFISMGPETIMKGFKIFYSRQSAANIVVYPYTIEADSHVVEVSDVTLVNSYKGVNFCRVTSGSAMVGMNIFASVIKQGIITDCNYEVSEFVNIDISLKYWKEYDSSADMAKVREFTKSQCSPVIFKKADGISVYGINIDAQDYPNRIDLDIMKGIAQEDAYGNMAWGTAMNLNGAEVVKSVPQEIPPTFLEVDKVQGVEYYYGLYKFGTDRYSTKAVLFNVKSYGAKGDGITDDTAAVKAAVSAAGENGGGAIFFPAGNYVVRDKLSMPQNTELKGEWDGIHMDCPATIYVYWGKDAASEGFIELAKNSGVHGISFYYPEITVDNIGSEEYSSVIKGMGEGVYAEYVNICNGFTGIDFYSVKCDNFYIKGLWAYAAKEVIKAGGGSKNAKMEFIWFSWGAWDLSAYADMAKAKAYSHSRTIGFLFGDLLNFTGFSLGGFDSNIGAKYGKQTGAGVENMLILRMLLDIPLGETALSLESGNNLVWVGYASGNGAGGSRQFIVQDSFQGTARCYGFENWGGSGSFLNNVGDVMITTEGQPLEILKLSFLEQKMGLLLPLIIGISAAIFGSVFIIGGKLWKKKSKSA